MSSSSFFIKSPADLDRIRDEVWARKRGSASGSKEHLLICAGGGCIASGEPELKKALDEALKHHGLSDSVAVVETGCLGPCAGGPVLIVGRDRTFYQNLKPAAAAEIIEEHLLNNRIVEKYTVKEGAEKKPVPLISNVEFFKRQTKVVLRNCGSVDPNSLEDYIGIGGYRAAAKALLSMKPEEIIAEMKKSSLRGRGGAGFPTGLKWEYARASQGALKYILCNADEGDPGAYMDRSVLEGDPHTVIEGMMVGAFAIGAPQGYVYVRAEYPLAVERLQRAIEAARACGLLGKKILGSSLDFDLEIRMGSGAFVCGEETALMASIEGRRGEPRPRPPFPAQKGLWDKPTVLNNVETFANVPVIIEHGGDAFAKTGTEKSKGTKVFALAGAVNNTGLVEVPIGISLREVVFDIGNGIPKGKAFKAAQIGGPSGGCIPAHHIDTPLDYDALTALGAIMGSGGLIVLDEDSCMVDVARFFLDFTQDESCGKCNPCREGTRRMLQIVQAICDGKGVPEDLVRLETLAKTIKSTSLCGLGQTAPNPVLSTLRFFRDEYEAHINHKKCPAGVCKPLIKYMINDNCTGCRRCARECPVNCITGEAKQKHLIDQSRCTKCGTCKTVCNFKAVDVI